MQMHFKNPSRDGDRIPSPVKRRCRSGGGAARDASGTAPGQMELVGQGEICWLHSSVVCALVAEKRNVECCQGGSLWQHIWKRRLFPQRCL